MRLFLVLKKKPAKVYSNVSTQFDNPRRSRGQLLLLCTLASKCYGLSWCLFFETGTLFCSSDCPGIHFVDQAGLELRDASGSLTSLLGLKAFTTRPSLCGNFFLLVYCFGYLFVDLFETGSHYVTLDGLELKDLPDSVSWVHVIAQLGVFAFLQQDLMKFRFAWNALSSQNDLELLSLSWLPPKGIHHHCQSEVL